jgi:hypothetical protein
VTTSRRAIALRSACVVIGAGISLGSSVHWQHTDRSLVEAEKIYGARAEQGDAKVQFDLGTRYYYGRGVPQDYSEAARWYRKAAEHGNARAQFDLGSMLHDGKGVPQDHSEAVRWFREAAEQGDQRAQSALGYAYYNGEGVPQEYSEAVGWYRKSGDQGYSLAQQALGYMYAHGQGVPQDDAQAVAWYRKAAEQGDVVAQRSLGYMYTTGRGVLQDKTEASRWYSRASAQSDADAKRAVESSASELPTAKTRYIELSAVFLGFSVGLWLSSDFLLPGRRLQDRRQLAVTLLGVSFLLNAGLSLYAFAHDIRFFPHLDSFYLARGLLAVLMIVTAVFALKKKPN